ncbi:MAG: 5-formyltetrahydrofolate cyclo-ligase [Actinomycetota bacterium]
MTEAEELHREKAAFRDRMRMARDAISPEQRENRAAAIGDRLVELLRDRRVVMIFLSFRSEVPTDGIIERLAGSGHRVAVPWVKGGDVEPVEFKPGEEVVVGAWGIREPKERRPIPPGEIDAVVTPGLGFDRDGYRMGYGGGYYDRLLRRVRPDALKVGIGFAEQIAERVPRGAGDTSLDLIVTDEQAIDCR